MKQGLTIATAAIALFAYVIFPAVETAAGAMNVAAAAIEGSR